MFGLGRLFKHPEVQEGEGFFAAVHRVYGEEKVKAIRESNLPPLSAMRAPPPPPIRRKRPSPSTARSIEELVEMYPDEYVKALNIAYLLGYEKGRDTGKNRSRTQHESDLWYARVALGQLCKAVRTLVNDPTRDVLDDIEMVLAVGEAAYATSDDPLKKAQEVGK